MADPTNGLIFEPSRRLIDGILKPLKDCFVGKDEIIDLLGGLVLNGDMPKNVPVASQPVDLPPGYHALVENPPVFPVPMHVRESTFYIGLGDRLLIVHRDRPVEILEMPQPIRGMACSAPPPATSARCTRPASSGFASKLSASCRIQCRSPSSTRARRMNLPSASPKERYSRIECHHAMDVRRHLPACRQVNEIIELELQQDVPGRPLLARKRH